MNLASRGLLGVAVGYSGWGDREMVGWKLLVGTAALQHFSTCLKSSSTRSYSTAALQHASEAELGWE